MMEKGFYHSTRGYWQTSGTPNDEVTSSYPEGTIEVPLSPGDNYSYNAASETWEYIPPPITDEMIDTERDRRIDEGAEFQLVGGLTIAITGRQRDQTVLTGVYNIALAYHTAGETNPVLVYRDRTNVNRMLTPQQVIDLYQKGLQWITAIMQVSWAMKDGTGAYTSGIPSDYTDDSHWPTPTDIGI